MQKSLPFPPRPRRRTKQQHHLRVIHPKEDLKPRRRVKLHQFFQRLLQNHMPTRTTRKAKVGREDHLHPLTRRRCSATTSSTKVGVIKVTRVYDAKMKDKKGRSRSRDSSRGKSKGSSSSAGPRREPAGSGRKVPAHLEASVSSYMQISRHQHLRKDQQEDTKEEGNSHYCRFLL